MSTPPMARTVSAQNTSLGTIARKRNALSLSFSSSSMRMRYGLEPGQEAWPGASAKVLMLIVSSWPVRLAAPILALMGAAVSSWRTTNCAIALQATPDLFVT